MNGRVLSESDFLESPSPYEPWSAYDIGGAVKDMKHESAVGVLVLLVILYGQRPIDQRQLVASLNDVDDLKKASLWGVASPTQIATHSARL